MRSHYHGARHSSVHSAGRWLQVRRGLLPACWGTTGGQPGCACIAASGSELTATSCHCLTCRQCPQRRVGPQSVAEAPWKKKTVHHHSSLILTLILRTKSADSWGLTAELVVLKPLKPNRFMCCSHEFCINTSEICWRGSQQIPTPPTPRPTLQQNCPV